MAMKVGLVDCPHIPEKSRIKNIIDLRAGPLVYAVTLHAEFTDVDSDTLFIFPKHIVREVMDNPPKYVPGSQCASCDFAAGRAENVFTHKRGNRIEQVCWKDPDPMRAVGHFISLFVERGLLPSEIDADAGGMGIPILARFNELGWPINGVNNESEPIDPDKYPSLGAENWHDGAIKLAGGSTSSRTTRFCYNQLTGRRAAPTSARRFWATRAKRRWRSAASNLPIARTAGHGAGARRRSRDDAVRRRKAWRNWRTMARATPGEIGAWISAATGFNTRSATTAGYRFSSGRLSDSVTFAWSIRIGTTSR
jgi:hypothetical protein